MCSDNLSGAVNQQERLDAYIAGFVDGEGSFSVSIQRNPTCRVGWQLRPEFHVSQNPERRTVLAATHDVELVRAAFPHTLMLAREPVAWGATRDVLTAENLEKARRMCEAFDEAAAACVRAAA